MNNLLFIFIGLNILNVIIQTVKSIATIKCGKLIAALVNAIAYGLYTVVVVYMMCDLTLLTKALIIGGCNLVGVYVVKLIEEKMRRDKLWKIETTVKYWCADNFMEALKVLNISYNSLKCENEEDIILNIYAKNQKESKAIKELAKRYGAKYFVSETKIL